MNNPSHLLLQRFLFLFQRCFFLSPFASNLLKIPLLIQRRRQASAGIRS
jgi:hypothetical protein